LRAWLDQFGPILAVGVESTGSYGAGLTRSLTAAGVHVIEVNQPHRHTRRRRGKSDPIDAEAAARKVLAGEATALPKDSTGPVESIRQLRVARDSAVRARAAALTQLGELIITVPAELREQLTRKTLRGQAGLCRMLHPDRERVHDPTEAGKLALRSLAERIHSLDQEITALEDRVRALVTSVVPATMALRGVGPCHTAQLLVTAGQNLSRLRSEAAFAHLCGTDPIPAPSGKTRRHRLNPGGDRRANAALHMIAVVRTRYCPRTEAYAERRMAEGLSKREIRRCLKRYIAREVYHALRADLCEAGRLDSL
jgi:transposase